MATKTRKAKLGKPLKATFKNNCTSCKNFMVCRDPDKSQSFLCNKFTHFKEMSDYMERDYQEKPKAKSKLIDEPNLPDIRNQKDLREFMRKQIKRNKIQETSSIPEEDDFLLAPNFITFIASKKYCGIKPYPKQAEIGTMFNQEYCPSCSDVDWLSDVPVDAPLSHFKSKIVLLNRGVCPKCGGQKSQFVNNGDLLDYYTLAGMAGQRGSKSVLTGMLAAYQTHRMLKLDLPPADYGLMRSQMLTCTFVAPTFKQAFDNLWEPYSNIIGESNWFRQYNDMLKHNKTGEELFRHMDTYLLYPHKRLMISPSAADGRTLRGYTRFAGAIDELGWFGVNDKNVKLNADSVFTAIDRSLFSLKNAHSKARKKGNNILPPPQFYNVSSPSSWQDKICRLVKESENSKTIFSFHYCLSGDTLISTDKGIRRLDSIQEEKNITGGLGPAKLSEWHQVGKRDVLEVETEDGYAIKATSNHEFKVFDGEKYIWKRLRQLKVGDTVCINLNQTRRIFAQRLGLERYVSRPDLQINTIKPVYMTPSLAYLMGVILSDGCLKSDGYSINIVTSSKYHADELQRHIKNVFGCIASLSIRKPEDIHKSYFKMNNSLYILDICSVEIHKWLAHLGLTIAKSKEKIVPHSIMEASHKNIAAFLAGFIDGDGYISSKQYRIGFTSSSKKLLQGIQLLTLNLGVPCVISRNNLYTKTQDDAFKLYKKIKEFLFLKTNDMYNHAPSPSRNDKFPVKDLLLEIRKRKCIGKNRCIDDDGKIVSLSGNYCDKQTLLRSNVNNFSYSQAEAGVYKGIFSDIKVVSKAVYDKLQQRIEARYIYTKVKTITYAGREMVYDLTMDEKEYPEFTANGLVVHNSTWDMNPTVARDHPDLVEAERKNPATFKRDYAADPPMSSAPFIYDLKKFKSLFKKKRRQPFIIEAYTDKARSGRYMTYPEMIKQRWVNSKPRCLAIDAGATNNSFAMAMGRLSTETERMIVDALIEIRPQTDMPINFSAVGDLILQIIEEYNVLLVAADRWQSKKLLDDIEEQCGIETITYSVKKNDFFSYRDRVYEGEMVIPNPEMPFEEIESKDLDTYTQRFDNAPVAHFLFQNVTVVETVKSVEKGENMTDDLFRATVLLHKFLYDANYKDLFLGEEEEEEMQESGLGVALATGGGTGGGTSLPGFVVISNN